MRTVISDSQGVVTLQDGGGTRVENSLVTTGNIGVGADPGGGRVIGSLTLTAGGSGYTNGTYSQVALTTVTGSGTGATADIVVATNAVTAAVLRNPGQGYAAGDTLSSASIGGGTGFVATVGTTASILRSDGTVVGTRIGAGTTTPRAGLDVASGMALFTSSDLYRGPTASPIMWRSALFTSSDISHDAAAANSAATASFGNFNVSGGTGTQGTFAYFGNNRFAASTAGQSINATGISVSTSRIDAADLATNVSMVGGQFSATVSTGVGAASTNNVFAANVLATCSASGHTVTDLIAFRGTPTVGSGATATTVTTFAGKPLGGTGTVTTFYGLRLEATTAPTITNRWGISQEDTAAKNVFAGMSAAGQAAGTVATAFVDVAASTTAAASLRLRSGTAPTSPNDGDIWFDGSTLKIRIGGVTRTVTVS